MTNEEAIKRLNKIKAIYLGMDNKSDVKALNMAIEALSAEKTAEWLICGKQGGIPISYRCSNCDFGWNNNKFKYCPNCGARMKGEQTE